MLTAIERGQIVTLLRFAQERLLADATSIDASRVIIGQPLQVPCNAATVTRRYASRAADLIETLTRATV